MVVVFRDNGLKAHELKKALFFNSSKMNGYSQTTLMVTEAKIELMVAGGRIHGSIDLSESTELSARCFHCRGHL